MDIAIVIRRVNTEANRPLPRPYCDSQLMSGTVRLSDNFTEASPFYRLFVEAPAVREMFSYIQWHIGQRPEIRVEQGGVLLGKRYVDASYGISYTVASKAIPAKNAVGTTGHLDITAACWAEIHDQKDRHNQKEGDNLIIVGWFHTHPNNLSVFMSATDQGTQSRFFSDENAYALVINPQLRLVKAFRSEASLPARGYLVLAPAPR